MRARRTDPLAASAHSSGGVRQIAHVRGTRESEKQSGYRNLFRRRRDDRQLLYPEPVLRRLQRAFSRAGGRADIDRGHALLFPFGNRFHLAGPGGRQDARAGQPEARGRQYDHAAAGQELVSARYGRL